MKVLICADHGLSDREKVRSWIARLQDYGYDTIIIGNPGPGSMIVDEEARAAGMIVTHSPLNLLGNSPDLVLAFYSDDKPTNVVGATVKNARRRGIETTIVC